MPSSKNYIDKEKAEKVAIPFEPSNIDFDGSVQARHVVLDKKNQSDFRVDKIVSQMTRLDEIEQRNREKDIEEEALRLSKEIQQEAYDEAYQLGLKHGKDEAYESEKNRISAEIESLHSSIQQIENLKKKLLLENKIHILDLCVYISKRLLMKEVETNDEYILSVIERAIEMAHGEEEITLKLSPQDFEFLSNFDKEKLSQAGLLEKTKLESDPELQRGGVVLETNYGVVDARVEQRIEKIEQFFSEDH